jgi:hypothetical protein
MRKMLQMCPVCERQLWFTHMELQPNSMDARIMERLVSGWQH